MNVDASLIKEFVDVTNDQTEIKQETTVYGTIVELNDKKYVRIDGSDLLTPIGTTVSVADGDRVSVIIKNHTATVTGNVTSPAAKDEDVKEIGNKISEFEIVIADKVSTKEFDAEKGRIDDLVSDNVTIKEKLTANEGYISDLQADNVTINEKLTAADASIKKMEVEKLDATAADIKYATVENLNVTNETVHNIEGDYASFKQTTTDKLTANEASIRELETKKLDAEEAEIKYANIDFANIGDAAIENFYAKSGVIQDVVISDGQVTGTLVGVTIKGDLIEGGTVVADKLVIQGEDGLYYKLNTNGETVTSEQTEYNSLSGTIITAKSVTAEKIAVDDLVAFNATIGGFNITASAIYSGVKESVDNSTRGIYLDKTGQMAIGDSNNYLKFFKNSDGKWQLAISADTMIMSSSGKTVETAISEAEAKTIVKSEEQYYQSTSPVSLIGGSWSTTQPTWTEGTYIWNRTAVTYGDGSSEYQPSSTGVCITGNTGAQGEKGEKGDQGERGLQGLQGEKGEQGIAGPKGDTGDQGPHGEAGKTSYFHIKYSEVEKPVSSSQITETPSTYIGTYVDFTEADSTDPTKYTWSRFEGIQGEKGEQGIPGTNGENGQTSYLHIAYANSSDGSVDFSVSDSYGKSYIGQYTDFTQADSTNYADYSWSKIKGEDGESSYFHIKYSEVSNPTTSSQMTETPSEYIGTYVDYTPTDSNDPSKYTWSRFQGIQGEKGDQGIPGTNGENGQTSYLHIKYSDVANPTSSSQINDTGGDYIGQYTDFTQADSTDPKKYTWSKIKGDPGKDGTGVTILGSYDSEEELNAAHPTGTEGDSYIVNGDLYVWDAENSKWKNVGNIQGPQGLPGEAGEDGKTSYFHVAYANSADGKTDFSVSDSTDKSYIGQYTDYIQDDSTDPTKYSWTKIKGDKGDKGDTGTGYTILLSNESHTFPGSTSAAKASSASTNVIAYINASQVSAKITSIGENSVSGNASNVSTGITGLTASVTNNGSTTCKITFNATTSLTTKSGEINITIEVDGKTFTKYFSFSLSLTGATGAAGAVAKAVDIIATSQIFKSTDGGDTFSPDTIKLTPSFQGGIKYSKWQYSTDGGSNWTDVSTGNYGLTILNSVLSISKSSSLYTDTITSISFKCVADDSTYYDVVTVVKLYDVTGIEIGGRNYIRNSKNLKSFSAESDTHVTTDIKEDSITVTRIDSGSYYGIYYTADVTPDAEYTFSFNVLSVTGTCHYSVGTPSSWSNIVTRIPFETTGIKSVTFTTPSDATTIKLYISIPTVDVSVTINNAKLETGNKATDWTPAPEDVDESINESIDNVNASVEETNERVSEVETLIAKLEDTIAMLVTETVVYYQVDYNSETGEYTETDTVLDSVSGTPVEGAFTASGKQVYSYDVETTTGEGEEAVTETTTVYYIISGGTSLMTQTSDGWTFNMQSIQSAVNDASEGLNDLTNTVGTVEGTVESLQQAVDDLGKTSEYVKIVVYEDEPCIELGESDSDFKLLITNTRVMFREGPDTPTYINTSGLVTKNIEVEEEVRQGGFVWRIHGNGNLGLIWKGVDS